MKRAEKNYGNLSFMKASEIYLKVAESGYKSKELFEKLGNTFYFNANYKEAAKWYGELFSLPNDDDDVVDAIYFLRYSQCLKNIKKDEKAASYYTQFLAKGTISNPTTLSTQDYIDRIQTNSNRYNLQKTSLNSPGVDFGTSIREKQYVVFASTKDTGTVFKRIHAWTGQPFMDLYQAKFNEDGTFGEIQKLKKDINTKHDETTATFTKDGKTMYFTRGSFSATSKEGIHHLNIYKSTLVDGVWKNVEEVPIINSNEYSTAHPALAENDSKLYYVSNKPGGKGLTDIYMVSISADGTIGTPQNLGNLVNTRGRDSFPFISETNELYFSSDGHFGLGGYDVFYIDLNDQKAQLLNIGKPINSAFDDIAFVIDTSTKKGFISSNRTGGEGQDDIYSFIETKPIKKFNCLINGKVIDQNTQLPVKNAIVQVLRMDGKAMSSINTKANGEYTFVLNCSTSYLVRAKKIDYHTKEEIVETKLEDNKQDFEIEKDEVEIEEGNDIAEILNIIIYFDLDKSAIRPDAEVELQKIVAALKLYPTLKIDVRSHTDSRADDAYNMALSNRRAKSTLAYIIKNGIDASRLTGRGYGESQMVNRCSNGAKCSESEHRQNRRSEFIVLGL